MAGPKSKIVRGAINELYELLNPERFKGDASPYPEQDWDKADGWRELVKQKKLSEKGALKNLFEDPNMEKFTGFSPEMLEIIKAGDAFKRPFPDSFITEPSSWRVKSVKWMGLETPYIEHKETQNQIEIPTDSISAIKEYVKPRKKLKKKK